MRIVLEFVGAIILVGLVTWGIVEFARRVADYFSVLEKRKSQCQSDVTKQNPAAPDSED